MFDGFDSQNTSHSFLDYLDWDLWVSEILNIFREFSITAFAVFSGIRTSPFRLQCFGRLCCVVLNCTNIPVTGLRQWTTVKVQFI